MQRITPGFAWPLFDTAAIRRIEQAAAAQLPPHTLMQRAGLATARLALAIAPHARTTWIACGPGNNGGDGFEAAMHLKLRGKHVVVTWLGDEADAPPDAKTSLARAREVGIELADAPPAEWDLAIDALLGIGAARTPEGTMKEWIGRMNAASAPALAIDLPSGLSADTGQGDAVRAAVTLTMLGLKPGLFTNQGRDAAGDVWLETLEVQAPGEIAGAQLSPSPSPRTRPHASHKGSYGNVAVIGGAPGMAGAALLAGTAALHAGAGRVFVGLLERGLPVDPQQPDLMLREWDAIDLAAMSVACGCGGGDAVRAPLPKVISTSRALVLDADALNAIALDTQLQALLQARGRRGDRPTVITPHPLEAARLLGKETSVVQADRLGAAATAAA